MNKRTIRIAGWALGLSLAVAGVGAAIGTSHVVNGNAATMVKAEASYSFSGDTLTFSNQGLEDTVAYNEDFTNGIFKVNFPKSGNNGKYYDNGAAIRSYGGKKFSVSAVDSNAKLASITLTFGSGDGSNAITVNVGTYDKGSWSGSANSVTFTVGGTSGNRRIASVTATLEAAGGPTVTGVSVTGNMSKTSYTTVESFSNAGLTATVAMSDSSSYTGDVSWSYAPTSPAAAVIANDNEEVTGLSVKATATAETQSGNKATSGIAVSYANVAQGLAAIPNANDQIDEVIVQGIVSYVDTIETSSFYNATYYISDDGQRENELMIYRGKGLNNADITNTNDIKVGDTVLVYGNLKYYNGEKKEFLSGNYLLDLDRPASSDPAITITEANFQMAVGDSDVTLHATAENVPDGGSVKWASGTPATATINETTGVVHAVAAGSTVITAKIVDSEDNVLASNSITVSVVENAIADGDTFIVKATHDTTEYFLTGVSNDIGTTSISQSNAMVFTAIESEKPGEFQFKNGNEYLSYSGSENKLYTTTDAEAASTLWKALNSGSGVVVESVNVAGRKLQFNYNSGNPRFACYSSSQTLVSLLKVSAPEVDEVTVLGDDTADAEGALSITKDFLYEITYVADEGTGAVTVTVLNSSSTTDGASVTTAPSEGSFSVTFTEDDTYTITVTSVENPAKSASTEIVVSNIYAPVLTDYDLYEGTTVSDSAVLTEGDYVFYYSGKAMKASIASDRAEYEEVTPSDDQISTDDSSIVWHVALDGDYYTIYNAFENKYLASTNSNNKAKLEATVTDNSRWTVEISNGTFEFVNKARAEAGSNNKYLRNNSTYGFAVYASSTGGALSLYKKAYDAIGYSSILLNYLGNVCVAAGNTNVSDLTEAWKIVGAEYALLDSSVKSGLTPSSASQTVVNAIQRYDYVVGKYNKSQGIEAINDFMNRNPAPVGAVGALNSAVGESGSSVTTLVIISTVSLAAIGGLFFYRKRRAI